MLLGNAPPPYFAIPVQFGVLFFCCCDDDFLNDSSNWCRFDSSVQEAAFAIESLHADDRRSLLAKMVCDAGMSCCIEILLINRSVLYAPR